MVFEETKQSFRGNFAYRFSWGTNRSEGWIQKRSKTEVIKSDDSHILRDSKAMFMQRFQNSDGCVVIPRKYSIERDPLSVSQKIIQGLISDVAFEFTIENQLFIKRNIICGEGCFIPHFAPLRILLVEGTTQKQNATLSMFCNEMVNKFLGDL